MADAEDATMELPTAVLTLLTAGEPNPLVPQPYEITVLVLGGLLVGPVDGIAAARQERRRRRPASA
ncbi:hypothetical protein AAG742_06640 [Micrococcus sp. 2A]|uniref:hypothetical protein n=2 Tax=Micrococcus TaxID=1269 RepID=UPI002625AC52|nr:hypothetical protein [uncultured Micrococcus sp.]